MTRLTILLILIVAMLGCTAAETNTDAHDEMPAAGDMADNMEDMSSDHMEEMSEHMEDMPDDTDSFDFLTSVASVELH